MGRGSGLETRPGIESPFKGHVIPNLSAPAGALALEGREEVRSTSISPIEKTST